MGCTPHPVAQSGLHATSRGPTARATHARIDSRREALNVKFDAPRTSTCAAVLLLLSPRRLSRARSSNPIRTFSSLADAMGPWQRAAQQSQRNRLRAAQPAQLGGQHNNIEVTQQCNEAGASVHTPNGQVCVLLTRRTGSRNIFFDKLLTDFTRLAHHSPSPDMYKHPCQQPVVKGPRLRITHRLRSCTSGSRPRS